MLDIIITHYKEPWEVGEKLFQMIGLQRCVDMNDIHVTVVNDGGNELPEEKLSSLSYPVKQLNIPHAGVSAARNAGIDAATEKWVMFCDFDDNFATIYALREIINVLNTDEYDMLWCKIVAENLIKGKDVVYPVPDAQRFVFCHGKVYRREFLIEKNIRFDTELTFNEDSCFNNIIVARTHYKRIGEIKSMFNIYSWIRRENSVTNSGRDDEATLGHFRRNLKVTEENRLYREPECYNGMVTRTVYDTYYMVHGKRISDGMKRQILDEFAPWIAEQIDVFGAIDDDTLQRLITVSKMELIDHDEIVYDAFELVEKWVQDIVAAYKMGGELNET